MSLTADQLAIINTLMYADKPQLSKMKGQTLKEIVGKLESSENKGGLVSSHEWDIVKKAVNNDPTLGNIVLKSSYTDKKTGDAGCVFANGNEAVIAFKGTGKGEWKDNANAGSRMPDGTGRNNTISPQQQKAIDFVNSQNLSGYDTVTVTGHSKGGNKAKIVTLLTDKVDRCVSFDGQGFSDDFMKAYKPEIQANQSKIQNHNADGDYVNFLLNDVGETYYHKSHRLENNPARYHSMGVLLDENGKLRAGQQSEVTKALDKGLNSVLRSLPPDRRRDVLRVVGDLMDAGLGTKNESIGDVLKNRANWDELAIIFTILPIALLSQIPGIGWIIKMLQGIGILPKTAPGGDIKYDDAPQPIDQGDMGGDTSLIFVEFAGVHALARQLQEAVERYNNACQNMKAAAMNLIDRWEGEGCNAFAQDQQMMLQWCQALGQSAFNIADHMIMTMQKYRDMENKLKQMML